MDFIIKLSFFDFFSIKQWRKQVGYITAKEELKYTEGICRSRIP